MQEGALEVSEVCDDMKLALSEKPKSLRPLAILPISFPFLRCSLASLCDSFSTASILCSRFPVRRHSSVAAATVS